MAHVLLCFKVTAVQGGYIDVFSLIDTDEIQQITESDNTGSKYLVSALAELAVHASNVSGTEVKGMLGSSVHLPCIYNPSMHGTLYMCWQKRPCHKFSSGCSPKLIKTDGQRVIERNSKRYKLNSNLQWGDVSLTIEGLTAADSGEYCCRVEMPGTFNDKFTTVTLKILKAQSVTTSGNRKNGTFSTSVPPAEQKGSAFVSSKWNLTKMGTSSQDQNTTLTGHSCTTLSLLKSSQQQFMESFTPKLFLPAVFLTPLPTAHAL
ncbi:T-cell immunoglobulin and mucin domain-containing protein 4-like [Protopterus annectens]|uniref:T-cell immunoglobulin and mucin domain-containing protein 4-like n=1 Tax=Protopterus annectens TaxID=7888 RepID=UPI001CFA42A2|nr:T-cell immunoglobulin and mucin domain-containing protein 4-like [Protopterus annectens]